MIDRLQHIENLFPNLVDVGYSPKSNATTIYNCAAYAAGDEFHKWQGYRHAGYWPPRAKEGHDVAAIISAFKEIGYSECNFDAGLEAGFEKVAIYAKDNVWQHAARQCEDGRWTSKIGNLEDIIHKTPFALTGAEYGDVVCFLKRSRSFPKPSFHPEPIVKKPRQRGRKEKKNPNP
jgi:hypothetical protein